MTTKRTMALLMCLLTVIGLLPGAALAFLLVNTTSKRSHRPRALSSPTRSRP